MKIGYARTSTVDQIAGLEDQIAKLKVEGCEEIFSEQVSSVDDDRKQLEAAIRFARKGDVLVVTKLDRLARSIVDALNIEKRLKEKSAALNIIEMQTDTSTAAGRLMFNLMMSIAQFEREVMLERQRVGMAKAKADGVCMGRKPEAFEKRDDVIKLVAEGVNPTDIAKRLKIGRASVYRILNAQPERVQELGATLRRWKAREAKKQAKDAA